MTDAPDKIWAHAPTTFDEMDVWQTSETDGAIEYTRTDIADTGIAELEVTLQEERFAKWTLVESPLKNRIAELEKELEHCIYELNRADSRKPHRDRRAGLARAILKGEGV
jgi:hypothetical protein